MDEMIFPLTIDQLSGKTLLATRSFFSEYDLSFAKKVVFGLRYKPDLTVEEAGELFSYNVAWNSQQWQIQHFHEILSHRFVVLRDGAPVLSTSSNNWQVSPCQFGWSLRTANSITQLISFPTVLTINKRIASRPLITGQPLRQQSTLPVAHINTDSETILPLLIYSLYSALVVENT